MAVGAQRKDIIMLFLGEGLKIIIPGLLLGNTLAALIMQVVSKTPAMGFIYHFIPRISLWEPAIFIGATAIMGLGTMLACYIPALKISFENLMDAVRQK
jgi:ABC-type antimicrobial peptide transport system permease subunit